MNELILMILFVGFPILNFLLLINNIRKYQGKDEWFKTDSGFIPEADHKKLETTKHKPRKRELYKVLGNILRDRRYVWDVKLRIVEAPSHLKSFDPWVLNVTKEELKLMKGVCKTLERKGYLTELEEIVNSSTVKLKITNPKRSVHLQELYCSHNTTKVH